MMPAKWQKIDGENLEIKIENVSFELGARSMLCNLNCADFK